LKKSEYPDVYGSYGDYYLITTVQDKQVMIRFTKGNFIVYDASLDKDDPRSILFKTTGKPFSDMASYLMKP
jgi:hypothetical protein